MQFVELFHSSDFSRDLLEAAPDPVVVVDKRGRIVLVNSQTSRVFGYDRAELIDQTVEILMPVRLRHAHERYRASYSERPEVRRMGDPMGVLVGKRKDGTEFPVEISLSPFHGTEGLFIISIIRDVSHRVEFEQRLRHMNTHDSLTGVYNRAFFDEEMARLGKGRSPVGIVVVDIDGLKEVNDRFGHDSGNSLIKSAAALLSDAFRAEDIVARIGGDEFAVLVPGVEAGKLVPVLERLRSTALLPTSSGLNLKLSLSLGSAIGLPGQIVETLRLADAAMYADKRLRHKSASPGEPGE